jgi:hypothetical protein
MDASKHETLTKLQHDCTDALNRYLKEATDMCKLLSAIQQYPTSHEERLAIIKQRVKEHEAQIAYDSVQKELFKLADWD